MGKKGKRSGDCGRGATADEEDALLDAALAEVAAEKAARSAVTRVDNIVDTTKPESDKKSYRLLELSNGLECLLVQDVEDEDDNEEEDGDEESGDFDDGSSESASEQESRVRSGGKRAAAALGVQVGSWADKSIGVQGLAHFLEHMLFMGSTKYPEENYYDKFVSRHGGATNAFTECEYTVYHFDVFPRALAEALDIFAQFFISPLFRAEAIEREVQAVESEFVQTKNDDESRLGDLLCREAGGSQHPYSTFTWGNAHSLVEESKMNGIDLQWALRELFNQRYIGPAMRLTVVCCLPLDEMEVIVAKCFGPVRRTPTHTLTTSKDPDYGASGGGGGHEVSGSVKNRAPKSKKKKKKSSGVDGSGDGGGHSPTPSPLNAPTAPFDLAAAMDGRLILVQPVKDTHEMRLIWALPEQLSKWRSKPSDLVAHLVGHEGSGSALALLREKGWATALTAGVNGDSGLDSSSAGALFKVDITLTSLGISRWPIVALVIHSYIATVRHHHDSGGANLRWVFDEVSSVALNNFRFREGDDPAELAADLAVAMLPVGGYGWKDVLQGSDLFLEWRPEEVTAILDVLRPDCCRVEILSVSFGRDTKQTSSDHRSNLAEVADVPPKQNNGPDESNHGNIDDEDAAEDDPLLPLSLCSEVVTAALSFVESEQPALEPRFGTKFWNRRLDSRLVAAWCSRAAMIESPAEKLDRMRDSPGAAADESRKFASTETGVAASAETREKDGVFTLCDALSLPTKNPFVAGDFVLRSTPDISARDQAQTDAAEAVAFSQQGQFKVLSPGSGGGGARAMDASVLDGMVSVAADFVQQWKRKICSVTDGATSSRGEKAQGHRTQSRDQNSCPASALPGPPFPRPSDVPSTIVPTPRPGGGGWRPEKTASPVPEKKSVGDDDGDGCSVRLWHLLDHHFLLPRAECYLRLSFLPLPPCSPFSSLLTPEHSAAADLACALLDDAFSERSYLASMAGLDFECHADEGGAIILRCWGFSEKAPFLLLEAVNTLLGLVVARSSATLPASESGSDHSSSPGVHADIRCRTMTPKRFIACREVVEKRYLNKILKPPKHAKTVRLAMLKHSSSFLPGAKHQALVGTNGSSADYPSANPGADSSVGNLKKKSKKNRSRFCSCHARQMDSTERSSFVAAAPTSAPPAVSTNPMSWALSTCSVCALPDNESVKEGLTLESMASFWLPLLLIAEAPFQRLVWARRETAAPQLFVHGNLSGDEADAFAERLRSTLAAAQPALAQSLDLAHAPLSSLPGEKNVVDPSTLHQTPSTSRHVQIKGGTPPSDVPFDQTALSNHAVPLIGIFRQPILNLRGPSGFPPSDRSRVLDRVVVALCSDDASQKNSACELYWQIGPSDVSEESLGLETGLMRRVLTDLLEHVMSEPLFDTLRTHEQLGYSVSCGARWTGGVVGFGVTVVSDTHHPLQVELRVLNFLKYFRHHTLQQMSPSEFRDQCESLAALKLERSLSLDEEAASFWESIADHRVDAESNRGEGKSLDAFFSSRIEAAALGKVTLDMLRAVMDEWILAGTPQPQENCTFVGCSHLGVHCIGQSAVFSTDGGSLTLPPPPPPGQAAVTAVTTPYLGEGEQLEPGSTGTEVASFTKPAIRVWLESTEDFPRTFAKDYEEFPCFVSGANFL